METTLEKMLEMASTSPLESSDLLHLEELFVVPKVQVVALEQLVGLEVGT